MKFGISGLIGLALAFAATPVVAQDEGSEAASADMDDFDQMMADKVDEIEVEPLTPEQQARLPAATRLVDLMTPKDALKEMYVGFTDRTSGYLAGVRTNPAEQTVAIALGVTAYDLDLTDEQAEELASLFDLAWQERHQRETAAESEIMREFYAMMEASTRQAMSELYAIRFNARELAEIEAFYTTDTGQRYTRESYSMMTDPRIIRATMAASREMLIQLGEKDARTAEATADLPDWRSYDDLSDAERAKVSEVTGFSDEEIRANLDAANWAADAAADAAEWDDGKWAVEAAAEEAGEAPARSKDAPAK